jgi:Flp pilus assembly protein TadG
MHSLSGLLDRFRRDEGGAFAVVFAVIAIVLVAMSGAVVDFTSMQQSRTRAQVALDAAALALQPRIYDTAAATIQSQAQALLVSQLADGATTWKDCASAPAPCVTVATPTLDTVNGQLTLTASLKVPMNFVNLVGVPTLTAQLVSVATRKKLNLEVAMTLDNSGSMAYAMGYNKVVSGQPTRMKVLQDAATCATNILFYGVSSCGASTAGLTVNPNVKIGLVPFTQAVNVGTANANATWMDRTGTGSWNSTTGGSNITDNNFDNDDYDNNPTNQTSLDTATLVDSFTGPVDRIALFSQMKDSSNNTMSWGGCVEARRAPYDTDDTVPDSTVPGTLFTPYFAPDEPDSGSFSNNYISDKGVGSACKIEPKVVWTQSKTKCPYSAGVGGYTAVSNYGKPCNSGSVTTNTYTQTDRNGTVTTVTSLPASIYNNPVPSSSDSDVYSAVATTGSTYTNTRVSTYTYVYSPREYQERLCKYNGAKLTGAVAAGSVFGPNGDCPAASIQPLTNTPATLISSINSMRPVGGTNITEGAAWGFRVLSPTDPFPGTPYSSATSKVLIVMTDGENTIYPGSNMNYDQYYSAYGYPWNGRLGTVTSNATTLAGVMNTRLSAVCNNAKALGITIYTIGVDTADTTSPAATQTLLTNCATQPSYAYFPNTTTDLSNAFEAIAKQLAALRLAR